MRLVNYICYLLSYLGVPLSMQKRVLAVNTRGTVQSAILFIKILPVQIVKKKKKVTVFKLI